MKVEALLMKSTIKIPDWRWPKGTGVRDKLKVLKFLHLEKQKDVIDFS